MIRFKKIRERQKRNKIINNVLLFIALSFIYYSVVSYYIGPGIN